MLLTLNIIVACPPDSYTMFAGVDTCTPCPRNTETNPDGVGHSVQSCICKHGFIGPEGGPCTGRQPPAFRFRFIAFRFRLTDSFDTCIHSYQTGMAFLDFDECMLNPCNGTCVNTEGSFQCRCDIPGYILAENGRSCICMYGNAKKC